MYRAMAMSDGISHAVGVGQIGEIVNRDGLSSCSEQESIPAANYGTYRLHI